VAVVSRADHSGGVALAAFLAGPPPAGPASQQRFPAVRFLAAKADHRRRPPGAWVCRRYSHAAIAACATDRL